jgi:hypothetical protein
MGAGPGRLGVALALFVSAAWIHTSGFDARTLSTEEQAISDAAVALERNGWRDLDGRKYPLLIRSTSNEWFAPAPVYATAFTWHLSNSAHAVRLASAIAGSSSVVLFYFAALVTSRRVGLATLAALLLLTTPAHVHVARSATHDGIWHVLAFNLWLLALAGALTRRRPGETALVAAAIALSVYSQPSGPLTSPLLAILSVIALRESAAGWATLRPALLTAALLSMPLLVWFARYPWTYPETFGSWVLHGAHIRNPALWAVALSNPNTLASFAFDYWDFFSPSHLFLRPGAPGSAGVFLTPMAVLIAPGVVRVLRQPHGDGLQEFARTALLALVFVPLAAATFEEPRATGRALAIAPAAALVAAYGVHDLWMRRTALWRTAVVLALTLTAWQFVVWYIGMIRQ